MVSFEVVNVNALAHSRANTLDEAVAIVNYGMKLIDILNIHN